jgi:hypothetical protein
MIDRHALLERTGDLVTAPMGEDLAMMDVDSGTYYVLDHVAVFVWERLATPTSTAVLCDLLQQAYDVSPTQCEADVLPFLQKLHGKGLIRVVE